MLYRFVALLLLASASSTSSAQTTRTFTYDELGRLVKVTPVSGTPICYGYDVLDNLVSASTASSCKANGQNAAPTPVNDIVIIQTSFSPWGGNLGVLFNDTDPNLPGDIVSVLAVQGSPYASVLPDGSDVYFDGPVGNYSLDYTVKDSQYATANAQITLSIVLCNPDCGIDP